MIVFRECELRVGVQQAHQEAANVDASRNRFLNSSILSDGTVLHLSAHAIFEVVIFVLFQHLFHRSS